MPSACGKARGKNTMQGPLEGIRIIDLSNVISGPMATMALADQGAEVIKIENPADGDLARKLGNVPDYNKQLMGTSRTCCFHQILKNHLP